MAKKFPQAPPDEPEGWLTSYADLMSLLSCFFMLMMAFANYDTPGVQVKAKIIADTFKDKPSATSEQDDMNKLKNEIAHHPEIEKKLKITLADGQLIIVFNGSVAFDIGSKKLTPQAESMLKTLIELIKAKNPDYRILIEGHASKQESLVAEESHWSLSAARAAFVISRFELYGFKSEHMVALAKGDLDPVSEYKTDKAGKITEEFLDLNRRVVIRVLEPLGPPAKMRVGALFREAEGASALPPDATLFKEASPAADIAAAAQDPAPAATTAPVDAPKIQEVVPEVKAVQ